MERGKKGDEGKKEEGGEGLEVEYTLVCKSI